MTVCRIDDEPAEIPTGPAELLSDERAVRWLPAPARRFYFALLTRVRELEDRMASAETKLGPMLDPDMEMLMAPENYQSIRRAWDCGAQAMRARILEQVNAIHFREGTTADVLALLQAERMEKPTLEVLRDLFAQQEAKEKEGP